MSAVTGVRLSENDKVLSLFLGKEALWSQKKHDLYAALVEKKFIIDTELENGITKVSVTAFGFTVSERHAEPFCALTLAAVASIKFLVQTRAGTVSLPKSNVPFSVAYHWFLRGLDIRRKSWPDTQYISPELGIVANKASLPDFLPEDLFKVVKDAPMAVMPRMVMTDRGQQVRYDWFAAGVDIMASDWEAF